MASLTLLTLFRSPLAVLLDITTTLSRRPCQYPRIIQQSQCDDGIRDRIQRNQEVHQRGCQTDQRRPGHPADISR